MFEVNKEAIEWHSEIAEVFDENYNDNKIFKQRYEVWMNLINRFSDSDYSLLDAGCGSGVISLYAASKCKDVIAIDGSEKMIRLCNEKLHSRSKKNIIFEVGNIERLSEKYLASFDIVLSSSVLEYLSDFYNSLNELCFSLKSNGILIISMPNKNSVYRKLLSLSYRISKHPKYYKHIKNILSLNYVVEKIKHNGFTILETGYYSPAPIVLNFLNNDKYTQSLFYIVAKKLK